MAKPFPGFQLFNETFKLFFSHAGYFLRVLMVPALLGYLTAQAQLWVLDGTLDGEDGLVATGLVSLVAASVAANIAALMTCYRFVAFGPVEGFRFDRRVWRLLKVVMLLMPVALVIGLACFGMAGLLIGGANPESAGALGLLLLLPLGAYLIVRLLFIGPAVALDWQGGMIDLVRHSWALTKGHTWPLLGLTLLFNVLVVFVSWVPGTIGESVRTGLGMDFVFVLMQTVINLAAISAFAVFTGLCYRHFTDSDPQTEAPS